MSISLSSKGGTLDDDRRIETTQLDTWGHVTIPIEYKYLVGAPGTVWNNCGQFEDSVFTLNNGKSKSNIKTLSLGVNLFQEASVYLETFSLGGGTNLEFQDNMLPAVLSVRNLKGDSTGVRCYSYLSNFFVPRV